MIEMDARRVSECGIHVRLPTPNVRQVGTHNCPLCRALVKSARTEPITAGPSAAKQAAGRRGGRASAAASGGSCIASMGSSDRSVAVRTRAGGQL